jgi:hypothetical protein
VNGLVNGLAVMADTETWTLWDHMTGEAFEGPLKGERLDFWGMTITTVEAALVERPTVEISISDYRSMGSRLLGLVAGRGVHSERSFFPPNFKRTMSTPPDDRLDRFAQGLGVIVDDVGRYYPMVSIQDGIEDVLDGRTLRISIGAIDGIPRATWTDDNSAPMQLLSRWYGFSYTYPGCSIYGTSNPA